MSGELRLVLDDADREWNHVVLDLVAKDRQQRVFEVESVDADLEAKRTREWNHNALDRVCVVDAEKQLCSADQ